MTRLLRSAYLIVRPTAADVLDEDSDVILSGHPATPGTWTATAVDAGWSEHRTPGGVVLHALRLNTDQTDVARGIWLVVQREPDGTTALIQLAGHASNVYAASLKDTWIAARAADATARGLLRHLPAWKVSGVEDDGEGGAVAFTGVRRIFQRDTGARVPADVLTGGAGPWHFDASGSEVAHGDPSEALHVTAWHRPGIMQAIAGYADETPEDGTPED